MRRPIIGITNPSRADLLGNYVEAVSAGGGSPLVLPVLRDPSAHDPVLEVLDGIIFSGGTDLNPRVYGEAPMPGLGQVDPYRDDYETALLARCIEQHSFPILGICRGMQLLNAHGGGSCYQSLEKQQPAGIMHYLFHLFPLDYPSHEVTITEGSRIHELTGCSRLAVNSFHHQGLKTIAEGYRVTASADDNLPEAIEHTGDRFIAAVQWHPEMSAAVDTTSQLLFRRFADLCGEALEKES